jgi:hypothetical protein
MVSKHFEILEVYFHLHNHSIQYISQFNSYFKFKKIINNPIPTYCGIGLHIF